MKNYFKVYRNGEYKGDTFTASLREAKQWIREGKVFIGTHMGEWKRTVNGYRYHTTVGTTIEFVRFGREV